MKDSQELMHFHNILHTLIHSHIVDIKVVYSSILIHVLDLFHQVMKFVRVSQIWIIC